ncbi:MAG: DUF1292 domain-containing protein [Candidatus Izimaplasma sp.]|nr:DUF1292 domain-containing protein [Candidatus Izimaplasma bacterium]
MEDKTFTVIDEEGKELVFEVVLTFKNPETEKAYVIYKLPGDENEEVFAAIYDEESDMGGNLMPIETDEEWDTLDEVLNSFLDEE